MRPSVLVRIGRPIPRTLNAHVARKVKHFRRKRSVGFWVGCYGMVSRQTGVQRYRTSGNTGDSAKLKPVPRSVSRTCRFRGYHDNFVAHAPAIGSLLKLNSV